MYIRTCESSIENENHSQFEVASLLPALMSEFLPTKRHPRFGDLT